MSRLDNLSFYDSFDENTWSSFAWYVLKIASSGFFSEADIVYIVLYFTIYAADCIVRVVKEFWYCIYRALKYQVIFNVIFYNKCRSIVHRQGWLQRSDIEFFIYWNIMKYLMLYSTIYAAAECIVRGGRRGLILLPTWYFATQLCDTHSQRRKY